MRYLIQTDTNIHTQVCVCVTIINAKKDKNLRGKLVGDTWERLEGKEREK